MKQLAYTLETIRDAAGKFWSEYKTYRTIAFNGEMGAGKTTFIHALCEVLGVPDAVSSPTFALINEYHFDELGSDKTIYHMDWYRLRDVEEAINAGLEDCLLRKDAYCFIEWPEKALPILPKPCLWLDITLVSDTERLMYIDIRN